MYLYLTEHLRALQLTGAGPTTILLLHARFCSPDIFRQLGGAHAQQLLLSGQSIALLQLLFSGIPVQIILLLMHCEVKADYCLHGREPAGGC